MNHEFFIEYKRGSKMFAKSKQTIDKESANKAGKTTYEETNQKTILDEINMASEENLIPPKVKSPPSLLSTDLFVKGNLNTNGDIQIEGSVEGNIKANLLTIGQNALIKGEIIAEEVVVNGRVNGTIRGNRVHLTSSAKVDGDIIHDSIAIDSGAHFEGSIEKSEDPLSKANPKRPVVVS